MNTRDLDRLVGRTELTPTSKRALRHVRKAVLSGRIHDPALGNGYWEVAVNGARLRFSFRKDKDGASHD